MPDLTAAIAWLTGADTRATRRGIDETALERTKKQYRPELTSLADIYRDPTAAPLATLAATVILAAFAYQAYVAAVTYHPAAGLAVAGVAYLAYRVAKVGWQAEREFVATELALSEFESRGESGEERRE